MNCLSISESHEQVVAPLGFGTRAVHSGCELDEVNGIVIPPITLSTTFAQAFPGAKPGKDDVNSYGNGYFYSRQANPTRGAVERALASLENGKHCSVFGSGLAATNAVICTIPSGSHVIALDELYGGTTSYFKNIAIPSNGIKFTFMDMADTVAVEAAITPETKLIWLESPTNPLLKSTDIRAISAVAKKHNLLLAVDSTFCSPYLQLPLELGADIVVHSVTKYIAGHSDVLMGAVVTNSDDIIKRIRLMQSGAGAVPSPFECYLAHRGIKTLHLRMEASMKNAITVANFLEAHPLIEKVIYPGLKSYQYYDIAKAQTKGPGAMIAIYIRGGLEIAGKFLSELKVFSLAVSLGAVESLACSPALMIPGTVYAKTLEPVGVNESLIRISIGIEFEADLIEDLRQALEKAQAVYDLQEK